MSTVSIVSGCTVSILGGYTSQTNSGINGKLDNQGTIQLTTDWTNNNSAGTPNAFSTSAGTVIFNGTGTQTISGTATTTFYNLSFNNPIATVGDVTLSTNNYIVSNQISMIQGNINLNGRKLTLGTSVGNPGTLSYTAGFFYGSTGTFERWVSATSASIGAIASNNIGYFPMGSSSGYFRPLWLTYTANLSDGGSVSIVHDPTINTTPASHNDVSWGNMVQAVSKSNWILSTANGFALTGSTGNLRYGGTGYGTNTLTDLNATLLASTIGTFGAATNVNTTIEVNRTALTTADFSNAWRIGTKDSNDSPLPIELLSFTAKKNGNTVDVMWKTASEINNDYFAVEKSTDGANFEIVEIVKGAGNSTVALSYTLVDINPYTGISYYRLKQNDFDGKYAYSKLAAVKFEDSKDINFDIFPNPIFSGENIRISFTSTKSEEILLVVYDAIGKKQYSNTIFTHTEGNNSCVIDELKKLAAGIYFITATCQRISYSRKLIVL